MPVRDVPGTVRGTSADVLISGVTVSHTVSTTQASAPSAAAASRTSASRTSAAPFPRRAALQLLFAILVVALVARTVFLIWEPPFTGALDYDTIAGLGSTYWLMNQFVGTPAFALTWVCLAIFVALLARGRSAAVTFASALLIGLGGLLFALVVNAEVLPFTYAADPATFSDAEGRALFDTFNGVGLLVPAIVSTQLVVAAGVLLALIVAVVTRALPRWFAIAGLVYVVAYVALPFELLPRGALIATDLLQTMLVAGIAWFSLRAALAQTQTPAPLPQTADAQVTDVS